jgi:hypothetical protein
MFRGCRLSAGLGEAKYKLNPFGSVIHIQLAKINLLSELLISTKSRVVFAVFHLMLSSDILSCSNCSIHLPILLRKFSPGSNSFGVIGEFMTGHKSKESSLKKKSMQTTKPHVIYCEEAAKQL